MGIATIHPELWMNYLQAQKKSGTAYRKKLAIPRLLVVCVACETVIKRAAKEQKINKGFTARFCYVNI